MPRPPPAPPSLSAKSGAALPGLRRRRVPWGGVGPAALPRFWRPLGLGPNALPRRFLRRVAALPLRPPLSGLRGPRCQDTARRGAHPAAQTPRGLRGGTWPAFWPPLAGEEPRGCSWRRAELQGRRRPGREPRAQSRSPRCLRVPGRASRAPRSAQRRRGDTPRGAAEGRRERSAGERRAGRASRGRCSANLRALTRGAAPRRSDISWPGAGSLELLRAGAALRVGPLHLPDRGFAPRAPSRSPSRPSLSYPAF